MSATFIAKAPTKCPLCERGVYGQVCLMWFETDDAAHLHCVRKAAPGRRARLKEKPS